MSVNQTTIGTGVDTKIVDVEATADGDTTATIPHGMAAAPQVVLLTPLSAAARISLWAFTGADATNVTLTKATTSGSGAAGVQVRAIIQRPHSIGR